MLHIWYFLMLLGGIYMKDLETKNLKIRKFRIEDSEDVFKNLATESKLEKCLGW